MSARASSDRHEGVCFVHQKSFEDASVDVLFSLKGVLRDWVEPLEHGEVVSFAILEADPQKGNEAISYLVLPNKVWQRADAQTKSKAFSEKIFLGAT